MLYYKLYLKKKGFAEFLMVLPQKVSLEQSFQAPFGWLISGSPACSTTGPSFRRTPRRSSTCLSEGCDWVRLPFFVLLRGWLVDVVSLFCGGGEDGDL